MGGGWLDDQLDERFPLDDELRLWRAIDTAEAYQTLLGRWYGFHTPLEAALASTEGLDALIDLDQRTKSRLLVRDLATFGVAPATVPLCSEIPRFEDVLVALCWLLAAERSTQWHEMIVVEVSSAIPAGAAFATAYLKCYGAHATARWTQLVRVVNGIATTQPERDRALASACDALGCCRRWIGIAS